MAIGTALTAATIVSTTAGSHPMGLNADGVSAVQAAIDSGGKITICAMSNHHDYLGNEPVSGGDYTRIQVHYTEYTGTSRDPRLSWVLDDSSTDSVLAEGSGNDDDKVVSNFNLDDSETWAEVRGDETTSGDVQSNSATQAYSAISSRRFAARGAVIRDIGRSYFVFDLSGKSGTVATSVLDLYLDNLGTSTGVSAYIIIVEATALAGTTADYGNCFVADAVPVTDNATFFGANF